MREPETLPARTLGILRNEANSFFLSDSSLLEASTLGRKGRVDFGMTFDRWLEKALAENLQVLPISARVAAAEHSLRGRFTETRPTASSRAPPWRECALRLLRPTSYIPYRAKRG